MRSAAFVRSCCSSSVRWCVTGGSPRSGLSIRFLGEAGDLPPLLSILSISRKIFSHSSGGRGEVSGLLPNRIPLTATGVPNVKNVTAEPLEIRSLEHESVCKKTTYKFLARADQVRRSGPRAPPALKMWDGRSYIVSRIETFAMGQAGTFSRGTNSHSPKKDGFPHASTDSCRSGRRAGAVNRS